MLRVDHVNVGHGDMSLVELPDGEFMLVDCNLGADSEALDFLQSRIPIGADGKRRIAVLLVTHPDADHITGIGVLEDEGFEIQQVWESKYRFADDGIRRPEYEQFLSLVERLGGSTKLIPGRQPRQTHGVDLYTFCSCGTGPNDDIHFNGLVIKIAHAGRAVLFSGDSDLAAWRDKVVPLSGPGENRAVENLLAANYLHASHHGSRTFFMTAKGDKPYLEGLELVNPDVTVISSLSRAASEQAGGDDQDWPPHDDAIECYRDFSGEVLITGEDGTVTFTISDNGDIARSYSADGVVARAGRRTQPSIRVATAVPTATILAQPKPWCVD